MASNDIDSKADSTKIKSYLINLLQKSTAMPFAIHENEYKCLYCVSTFLRPSKLREHINRAHDLTNIDHQSVWSNLNLESYVMLDIQHFYCRLCRNKISNINEFKTHLSEEHNEPLPKDVLEKVTYFKLYDDLIECLSCSQDFANIQCLIDHLKSHVNVTCQICCQIYSNKKELLEHDKVYCKPCTVCHMRFKSKKERDAHLKQIHCFTIKIFTCDICSLQFAFKGTLSRHIRNVHLKEKNKTCDICGKRFFDSYYLKLHKICHRDTKEFECDICKKKFARVEALKVHKRIHSGDRRYSCKICGKSFVQWTALNMHKVVHTDERNFKCPVCDRAFKEKKTMDKHCKKVHQRADMKFQSNLYLDC